MRWTMTGKAKLVALAATTMVAASVAAAFAAPVLQPGVTTPPHGDRGACTNCHTYASPPPPVQPPVVTPPPVQPPVVTPPPTNPPVVTPPPVNPPVIGNDDDDEALDGVRENDGDEHDGDRDRARDGDRERARNDKGNRRDNQQSRKSGERNSRGRD